MNPIKIYFAVAWKGGKEGEKPLAEEGVQNKLCSYVYPEQLSSWLEAIRRTPRECGGNIIVDSGAFSAWNRGKTLSLDDYTQYSHDAIARAEELGEGIRITNLDVIPGKVGQTKSLTKNFSNPRNAELIEEAAKRGYENFCEMLRNGITPIHVFHQGESFKWLDKMLEKTDYIGISPANDMPEESRKNWIASVFKYLHENGTSVKTHGFAVYSRNILLNYPWTSCDAASWRIAAGLGNIYFPVGGYKNPDFSKEPIFLEVSEKKTTRGVGRTTNKVAEILEESGFTFEEIQQSWEVRARLNIKYLLTFEKWLNKQRAKKEYKPRKTLI